MNLSTITKQRLERRDLLGGDVALHIQYPNEFEYYAMAFELINSLGKSVEFFGFPFYSENYTTTHSNSNSTLQKTIGGNVLYFNQSFEPIQFQLNGSFGRNFKKVITKNNIFSNNENENFNITETKMFSTDYKTGYACSKMLEAMLLKSKKVDEYGKPYKLFFYNLGFNQSFIVKYDSLRFPQNVKDNMIFNYELSLTAISPIENFLTKRRETSVANLTKTYDVEKSMKESAAKNTRNVSESKAKIFAKKIAKELYKF